MESRLTDDPAEFFEADPDVMLACTVNGVGIMGAGIALPFKLRFPKMFARYVDYCRQGVVQMGTVGILVKQEDIYTGVTRDIILLPTKNHWQDKSDIVDVRNSLMALRGWLDEHPGKRIRLPAPGAGNGEIDPEDSLRLVEETLGTANAEIVVYLYRPRSI